MNKTNYVLELTLEEVLNEELLKTNKNQAIKEIEESSDKDIISEINIILKDKDLFILNLIVYRGIGHRFNVNYNGKAIDYLSNKYLLSLFSNRKFLNLVLKEILKNTKSINKKLELLKIIRQSGIKLIFNEQAVFFPIQKEHIS